MSISSGEVKGGWAATWDFLQCGMRDHQSLRSACAYAQSDQNSLSNILGVLSYWLNTIWSFKAYKEAAQARLNLHLSKCHMVGNRMLRLKYVFHSTWWNKCHIHSKNLNILDMWTKISDFQQCGMCDQQRLRPACAPAHTGSLIRAFPSNLNILWILSYWPDIIWSV